MAGRGGAGGLEALLQEKAGLLESMLEETEKQRGLIESGDTDGLTASVEARKKLMDRVDEVDARIGSQAGAGPSELSASITGLLQRIIEMDKQNLETAEMLKRKLASGIKETNAEKNLLAYGPMHGSGNVYINRKG